MCSESEGFQFEPHYCTCPRFGIQSCWPWGSQIADKKKKKDSAQVQILYAACHRFAIMRMTVVLAGVRLNPFGQSTIPQKQFIILINSADLYGVNAFSLGRSITKPWVCYSKPLAYLWPNKRQFLVDSNFPLFHAGNDLFHGVVD